MRRPLCNVDVQLVILQAGGCARLLTMCGKMLSAKTMPASWVVRFEIHGDLDVAWLLRRISKSA